MYIYHVTTNTGHAHKSPRSDVGNDIIDVLLQQIASMEQGNLFGIVDDKYSCRLDKLKRHYAVLTISRLSANMVDNIDIIQFSVCWHNRRAVQAWQAVGGQNEPPQPPFCAVEILPTATFIDIPFMPIFADFERCIAWALIERQAADKRGIDG